MNYLIPVDARLKADLDVQDEAVPLDRVLQVLEPANKLRLVILDACRDNPFLPTMRRTVATRAVTRGLAQVEPSRPNTLIAFAAKAGSTADDGDGEHSPFTEALLKHIAVPGLDIRLALGRVRDDVIEKTKNAQEPFVYGSPAARSSRSLQERWRRSNSRATGRPTRLARISRWRRSSARSTAGTLSWRATGRVCVRPGATGAGSPGREDRSTEGE